MCPYKRTGIIGLLVGSLAFSSRAAGDGSERYFAPEMETLEALYGVWKVTVQHFDAAGERVATVEGKETVSWVLNDRAIQRDFRLGPEKGGYHALGFLTWNVATDRYEGVWFDNASVNGPTRLTGVWDERAQIFRFDAEATGEDGARVRYRIEDRLLDSEKRVVTTYLNSGETSTKLMEAHYKRATPCPGGFRPMDAIPP